MCEEVEKTGGRTVVVVKCSPVAELSLPPASAPPTVYSDALPHTDSLLPPSLFETLVSPNYLN